MSELVKTPPAVQREPASAKRAFLAFGAVVAGFAALFVADPSIYDEPNVFRRYALAGFAIALLAAPLLTQLRSMAAQIFSRAILFQLVCFGALALIQNTIVREGSEHVASATVLILSGLVPLLILGRAGFSQRSRHFEPNAFRRTLLGSLVFGLADTWALAFYAVMIGSNALLVAGASVMAVALFGLFRMKVWGLALCIVANLVIAGLAISGALDLPGVLAVGLATTAGIQLLLPLPLLKRIVATRTSR